MAKFHESLTDEHIAFIEAQKIFFFGSSSPDKGVNVSPRGILPLKVLEKNRVAYLDFFGSGNRTAEDSAAGSPVTIMFCSFDEKPTILRLFCRAEPLSPGDGRYDEMIGLWDGDYKGSIRNIFIFHIDKVQVSCGFGVPLFSYQGERKEAGKLSKIGVIEKVKNLMPWRG